MKTKKLFWISFFILVFGMAAVSFAAEDPQPAAPVSPGVFQQPVSVEKRDPKVVGEELIQKLFSGYQNYFRPLFNDKIARQFSLDRLAFLKEVEDSFFSVNVLETNFHVDQALLQDGKLVVGFSWSKKVYPRNASAEKIVDGKSEFVFVIEENQWKLFQINQDNPFTKA